MITGKNQVLGSTVLYTSIVTETLRETLLRSQKKTENTRIARKKRGDLINNFIKEISEIYGITFVLNFMFPVCNTSWILWDSQVTQY